MAKIKKEGRSLPRVTAIYGSNDFMDRKFAEFVAQDQGVDIKFKVVEGAEHDMFGYSLETSEHIINSFLNKVPLVIKVDQFDEQSNSESQDSGEKLI